MVNIHYSKLCTALSHVWFCSNEEQIKQFTGDITYIHGVEFLDNFNFKKCHIEKQITLVKDLSPSQEEIFLSFGKHLRQYIKRSLKDDVKILFLDSKDITKEIISEISVIYQKMYAAKGIKEKFNKKAFKAYMKANALCLGVAIIQNKIIGFDAIIYDNNCARLWMTAFLFRSNENDSQLVSRAHQRLDWELLLWCKNRGIKQFDFGGVSSFEKPNGIDEFKLKFEKQNKIEYWNIIKANTFIGSIILFLIKKRI